MDTRYIKDWVLRIGVEADLWKAGEASAISYDLREFKISLKKDGWHLSYTTPKTTKMWYCDKVSPLLRIVLELSHINW